MKIFQILFFTFLFIQAHGQEVFSGKIIDKNSKEHLAYVNIGIIGKNIGTVSGIDGNFSIQINAKYDKDTLRLSMIGYESLELIVADFKKQINNDPKIKLAPSTTRLKEVVVSGRDLKEKTLGNKVPYKNVSTGFSSNDLGNEIGIVIKIKKSPTYLKSFNCFIVQNKHGKVKFRLNIYSLKKGMPDKNILNQNIFVETDIEKGPLTVDLTKYNIWVEDDFFVALEWIEDLGKGGLFFSARLFGKPMIERTTSQAVWNKIGIAKLGFNVTARY